MRLAATIATLLLASACATAARTPAVHAPAGQDFRLAQGQTGTVDGEPLVVRFTGVLEDSRCPAGRQCIRAGEARIQVELRVPGHEAEDVSLATDPEPRRYASYEAYDVHLVALDPLPSPDVARPRYVATLRVTKH
jgi:hypothetical protein